MPDAPKRSRRCLVTFTDSEVDALSSLAKARGLKIATMIRSLVVSEYLYKKGTRRAPAR